jgi:D-alanyl-D-alanine endopeptidase (penicillin-binding protein 7)
MDAWGAPLLVRSVHMLLKRPILVLAAAIVIVAVAYSTPETSGVSEANATLQVGIYPASASPQWTYREQSPKPGIPKRPRMRCGSAIVIDNTTREVLYARRELLRRPIASLSKLLTTLVLLESGTDLTKTATITKEDAYQSSRSNLRTGEEYTLRDLLYAALVGSDNRAARALSRSAGIPADSFIVLMNAKAASLGMDSTSVVEPTGLSEQNVSTAYDCAVLLDAALRNHLIQHISTTSEVTIKPLNRKRAKRLVNTNRLLRYGYDFIGSKTGYISEAGWCIAARGYSDDGHDVTVVVLGAPTNGSRFRALRNALLWAYKFPRSVSQES